MKSDTLPDACRARLELGVDRLGLQFPDDTLGRLLEFIALLQKWNRTFNLTAVRDPLQMVERHLLDSLTVLPFLHGRRILDIGTGAGLPGIPLALASPERDFVLLDSNGKKIRFVRQAILQLGMQRAEAVQSRVEAYRPALPFDTLITRAFAPLPKMLELTRHLLADGESRMLAMKGSLPLDEIRQVEREYRVEVHDLQSVFANLDRHLITINPRKDVN